MSRSDPFRNDTSAIIFVVLESFEAQLQAILLSGKLQLRVPSLAHFRHRIYGS